MHASPPISRTCRPPLSPEQIRRLCRTAEVFAEGVVRCLNLSRDDWSDLRQDIALQVLLRLRHFDERRAPFGAFVDLIARRAAGRLKARAARRRERELLLNPQFSDPVGLSEDGADDQDCRTTLFYADDPRFARAEFRHDLRAALDGAPARIAGTFALVGAGPNRPPASRTTWYRRRVELRRWLLAHGLAPPR